MSVSDGQTGNASTFNSAFVSRTTNSTVIAQIDLNDPASGDQIPNVQLEVNKKSFKVDSTTLISNNAQITIDENKGMQAIPVVSSGGSVSINNVPFTATSFFDGMQVRLIGTDDSNAPTLVHNDAANGAILNGDITLNKYVQITLMYVSSLSRWIEIGRNL